MVPLQKNYKIEAKICITAKNIKKQNISQITSETFEYLLGLQKWFRCKNNISAI